MTEPVRVRSHAQLAAGVPALLGFTPDHGSVILICLKGSRVGLTLRADYDSHPAFPGALAANIHRGELEATSVMLIGWFTDETETRLLFDSLDGLGTPMGECLVVGSRGVRDVCPEAAPDAPWEPLPEDLLVRPAGILIDGEVVAPSRAHLARLIEPEAGAVPPGAGLLLETGLRDAALAGIARLEGEQLARAMEDWAVVARRGRGRIRSAALCLVAVAAWLRGNGALARIALEACPADYALAALLGQALSATTRPSDLRQLLLAAAEG